MNREEKVGGRTYARRPQEEEAGRRAVPKTAQYRPALQVSAETAEVGASEGLPAYGGGVYQELGAPEAHR